MITWVPKRENSGKVLVDMGERGGGSGQDWP